MYQSSSSLLMEAERQTEELLMAAEKQTGQLKLSPFLRSDHFGGCGLFAATVEAELHFSGCGFFADAVLMATVGKVKRRKRVFIEKRGKDNQKKSSLCLIRPKFVREEHVCSCRLSRKSVLSVVFFSKASMRRRTPSSSSEVPTRDRKERFEFLRRRRERE